MSWTDRSSIKTILQLADDFGVENFIETGTFKGTNALLHSHFFKRVFTCEINPEYAKQAAARLPDNVFLYTLPSPEFLHKWRRMFDIRRDVYTPILYLDAHFYDPSLPKERRFVVLSELEALKGLEDCIIIIHDFDCEGLGHLTYDGISLNFELLREKLAAVNPNFVYYTNTREYCDTITADEVRQQKVIGVQPTEDVLDNLEYAWSAPEKTYRGILYCVPRELNLKEYNLKKLTL